MKLSRTILAQNIARLLETHNPTKVSRLVAEYLLKNNRTSELPSIMRDLAEIRYQNNKTIEVTAVTTTPLNKTQVALIKSTVKDIYPQAKQVLVNFKIDDSVIGGIRLEFANSQLDMTVASKIARLRKLISSQNGVAV